MFIKRVWVVKIPETEYKLYEIISYLRSFRLLYNDGIIILASDSISKRENCLKLKLTKLPDSQEKNGLDEWLLCQWCQTISQLCTTSRLECKLVIIAWFYKYNWIYVWHQGALMWSERERNVVGPSTFKGGQNLSLHSIDFKMVPLFSLNTY